MSLSVCRLTNSNLQNHTCERYRFKICGKIRILNYEIYEIESGCKAYSLHFHVCIQIDGLYYNCFALFIFHPIFFYIEFVCCRNTMTAALFIFASAHPTRNVVAQFSLWRIPNVYIPHQGCITASKTQHCRIENATYSHRKCKFFLLTFINFFIM